MPTHTLVDPELRRARALLFIERRIKQAMSIAQVAAEFKVGERTVTAEIDWAKRQGILTNFEDQIIEGLVPDAIKAFKTALANGDTQVALEVLKGTGLLRKPSDKPLAAPAAQEDSLEIHIKRIRGTNQPALPPATSSDTHVSGFLEGAVLGPEEAPQGVGTHRDEDNNPLDG